MRLLFTLPSVVGALLWTTLASAQGADDADVEIPAKLPEPVTAAAPTATVAPAQAPARRPTPAPGSDLEARIAALEAAKGKPSPAAESDLVRVTREPSLTGGFSGPLGLVISGYAQAQYENSQLSEDQLQQGGIPLNQDRFLVRRARIRVDRAFRWASTTIEIDGNTTRGPAFGLRRAEVSLLYRNSDPNAGADAPPYVRLTGGLSEIPFGYEMTDSSRSRLFTERSLGSLALFPSDPDVGVRLSGGFAFFRYALAAINGEAYDDRPGRFVRDPNRAKDIVARVGVDTRPSSSFRVSGGTSFLTGKGFHPGTDATKGTVAWRDLNENGVIDGGELNAIPGSARTPSENFNRWAIGVDLELALDTWLGRSRLYGEAFVAQNADRGLMIADPIASGYDAREFGFYVAATQEVTRWAVLGFRFDRYDPNADAFDKRGGKLIPADASITTLSPVIAAVLPDRMRLSLQYDFIQDTLARSAVGVPTDLKNDQVTLRLQGEL